MRRKLLKLALLLVGAAVVSGVTTLTVGKRLSRLRKVGLFVTLCGLITAALGVGYKLRQRQINNSGDEDAYPVQSAKSESSYVLVPDKVIGHPRLLLTPSRMALAQRHMKENTFEFQQLDTYCKRHLGGRVAPVDEPSAPQPNIVEGYQGEEYYAAIASHTLCAKLFAASNPKRAKEHADLAKGVLMIMSEPTQPHGQDPLKDSGYVIRFYGVGMALGYDALYNELTPQERKRVVDALVRWVDAFEQKGFEREHPQGNYFAGFYAAKALGALAIYDDDPRGEAMWQSWLKIQHGGMVAPYYRDYMTGGGWPEGWRYGSLATINMSLPAIVAESARGISLIKSGYQFPLDQGDQLLHFTWPPRDRVDDRGDPTIADNAAPANPHLFAFVHGTLAFARDPRAPRFHALAKEVREKNKEELDDHQAWRDMLFWDPWAPDEDFKTQPTSFFSQGMQIIAMRNDWSEDSVWASFTSGPFVLYPGSGGMYFDQGSLAISRGKERFLVNTFGALYQNTPGTNDGNIHSEFFYGEMFGDDDGEHRNRRVFNIFYVKGKRYGQIPNVPWISKTKMARVVDRAGVINALGVNIEDMYYPPKDTGQSPLVKSWRREMIYIRPSTFVLDDDAEAESASSEQWMAFHFAKSPASVGDKRFDVAEGNLYRGRIEFLQPRDLRIESVNVQNKVTRLEAHPTDGRAQHRFVTVLDARSSKPTAAIAESLASPTASPSSVFAATLIHLPDGKTAVTLTGNAKEPNVNQLTYRTPATAARHIIADINLTNRYDVDVKREGSDFVVTLKKRDSAKGDGVMIFNVDADGRVSLN